MTLTKFLIYINTVIISVGLNVMIQGCSSMREKSKIKQKQEYTGVDPLLQPYVDEFFKLSAENHLVFKNSVSMGFTDIKRDTVIGTCTYQTSFREIDIDKTYFKEAGPLCRKILVFHEMIHCYCNRDHDHNDGVAYPLSLMSMFKDKVAEKIPWCLDKNPSGYFDDGCANTIMHPVIQDEWCIERHYDHYLKEMFNRCDPF